MICLCLVYYYNLYLHNAIVRFLLKIYNIQKFIVYIDILSYVNIIQLFGGKHLEVNICF